MIDPKTFFQRDRFAGGAGIELIEVGKGTATARMTVGQQHLNAVNSGHGGAIFTLADFTFAVASNSEGTVAVAVNAHISYVKAAKAGDVLTASAKEITQAPKLRVCTVQVHNQDGELIAIFEGLAYRKNERLEDHVQE